MGDPGIWTLVVGVLLGTILVSVLEIAAVRQQDLTPSRAVLYSACANILALLIFVLSVFVLIGFWGFGLIVAMDKGYDSGSTYLTIGTGLFLRTPVLVFLERAALFILFKIGTWQQALVYGLISTVLSLVIIAFVSGVALTVGSAFFY